MKNKRETTRKETEKRGIKLTPTHLKDTFAICEITTVA